MGRFICKIDDMYFQWSSIVDGPITQGMTLDELKENIKEEQGEMGLMMLPERLERVEKIGTSARHYENLEDLYAHHMSKETLIKILKGEI